MVDGTAALQFILAGGHGYRVERQMVAVVQPDGVAGRVSDPDLGVPVHRPVDYRDEVDVRAALPVVPPGPGAQQYHALGVEPVPEVPGCGNGPGVGSAALFRQSVRCHDRSNAVVCRVST